MARAIFDTRAFIKRLTAAGMPEQQAKILAEEQWRLIETRLATKGDIAALQTELVALKQRIKDQLTIRLGSMLAVAIAIVAALVKLP